MGDSRDGADNGATKPPRISPTKPEPTRKTARPRPFFSILLEESFFFHGETSGVVADHSPKFEPNSLYPWLTPYTFNGWLVPDGASRPLGELELEESLRYDFRANAIRRMLDFIRPLNAAANLPSSFFYRYRREQYFDSAQPYLPHLLEPDVAGSTRVICIVGHKCAGKTTASEYLTSKYGAGFFEASEELRLVARDAGVEISSGEAAHKFLLEHGQSVVARQIVEQLSDEDQKLVVISGFRTVEEIEFVHSIYPETVTILVTADRRIRFERHMKRGRDASVKTADDFQKLDDDQLSFGLLRVADEIAQHVIVNEGDLSGYYSRLESVINETLFNRKGGDKEAFGGLSEFHRSLVALNDIGHLASCEEISTRTDELGGKVWRYNTNRALKAVQMFVDRLDEGSELLSYSINPRGKVLLRVLNKTKTFGERADSGQADGRKLG